MKYRDLVGVIVLVGLMVLWMSRPAPVEVAPAPTSTAVPAFTPTPDIKAESRLTDLGPASSLLIEAVSKPEKLEDLKFKITVAAKSEFIVPLDKRGLPQLDLNFRLGEKFWDFRPANGKADGSVTVREGQKSWEIALKDFQAPDDLESLREAYGKERLQVTAILSEDEGEPDPSEMMSRKISRFSSGQTYLEP